MAEGSSPHTRGARADRFDGDGLGRIIPAYAGSTHQPIPRVSLMKDHPRIRGEHSMYSNLRTAARGSSPHTRGARRLPRSSHDAERIIPAYAGSTKFRSPYYNAAQDHPRIRGEHYCL